MSAPLKCGCEGSPHELDLDAAYDYAKRSGKAAVCLGDVISRMMAGEPLTDLDRTAFVHLAVQRIETNRLVNLYNDAILDAMPVKGGLN